MSKLKALLYGAAIGAGLMYFLDPVEGNRRKAMVRDHLIQARNDADDAFKTGVRDLRQRAKGMFAEGMALVSEEGATDELIAERIRARLGFLSRHPGAINIDVHDKVAILSGDVLQNEVDGLIAGVGRTRGVKGVENHLVIHQSAENLPQLQGAGWMPGDTARQWTPATRLLAGAGAAYLLLYGTVRGGFLGNIARLGGIALGARAFTNLDYPTMLGLSQSPDAIRVRKTINIDVPVDQVYNLWSNFENFPRFMSNVEDVRDLGNGRSHWVVKGPAGSKVEFDAITTEEKPNQIVAWKTTDDSTVKHQGQVRFKEDNKQGTQVSVNMAYNPPAGVVGHAVASFFGVDPKSSMDSDLVRMKSLLEEGKTSAKGHKVSGENVMSGSKPSRAQAGGQIPHTGREGDLSSRYSQRSDEESESSSHQMGQDMGPNEDQSGMIPHTGNMSQSNQDMTANTDETDLMIVDTGSEDARGDRSSDFVESSYDEDASNPPIDPESGDEENSHPLSDT